VIAAFPPKINKWQGVLKLAAEMNLDPARIVTVGDDVNDLEMLQNAALSFAMGTASPEVQRRAKRVTGGQPDGGVAQAIRQVLAQM
jgi:hydroxymethylpyrimidine pyrophosphatase-like HAD family hydrolase